MPKLTKPKSYQIEHKPNMVGAAISDARTQFDTFISFSADFLGGPITGQPELSDKLQEAIVAAYTNGISHIMIVGDFYINKPINQYPGVTLVGGRYDATLIRAHSTFPAGKFMIQSYRPTGWNAGCHNLGLKDIYLVGKANKSHHAVDYGDASYFKLDRVRCDLFDRAICFNYRIDETRVQQPDGSFLYPDAHSPASGGQSYFGTVSQCYAGNCRVAVTFAGVFNRNTFTSNSWFVCDLAYDFSNPRNVVETNLFQSCNIEGCLSAFEWHFNINSPYHNVWVNTSFDMGDPTKTMLVKLPGRQTFIGYSIFPYNSSRVSIYNINPDGVTDNFFGTGNGFTLQDQRMVNSSREEFHAMAGIKNKVWNGVFITQTLAPKNYYSSSVTVTGLKGNSAVTASLSKLYAGLIIQASSSNDNVVNYVLYNASDVPIVIDNQYLSITGIDKSFR